MAIFVAPRWVVEEGNPATIFDVISGNAVELGGLLAKQLMGLDPNLVEMTRSIWADVTTFAQDLKLTQPVPFTRAHLMRGTGWQQLFVELTASCNERCLHCYAASSPERTEHLPEAFIEGIVSDAEFLQFDNIQLTGGDPLVAPSFEVALTCAMASKIPEVEIYTNALLLSGPLYEKLPSSDRLCFAISFYSHDPLKHDHITRRPGSFQKTLSAIRRLVADKRRLRVNVITFDDDSAHLSATIKFIEDQGVDPLMIGSDQVRTVGRGTSSSNEEVLQPDAGHLSGETPYFVSPGVVSPNSVSANAEPPKPSHHAGGATSGNFPGRAAVLPNGDVVPCIFSRSNLLGSLHQQGLAAILNDETPLSLPRFDRPKYEHCGQSVACHECRVRNLSLETKATETRRTLAVIS